MSHDLLRVTRSVIGQIDLRVLPQSLAVNLVAIAKLIDEELAPKEVAKPAAKKKPTKKKATKKKVANKK